jgi:hypothetical protein
MLSATAPGSRGLGGLGGLGGDGEGGGRGVYAIVFLAETERAAIRQSASFAMQGYALRG